MWKALIALKSRLRGRKKWMHCLYSAHLYIEQYGNWCEYVQRDLPLACRTLWWHCYFTYCIVICCLKALHRRFVRCHFIKYTIYMGESHSKAIVDFSTEYMFQIKSHRHRSHYHYHYHCHQSSSFPLRFYSIEIISFSFPLSLCRSHSCSQFERHNFYMHLSCLNRIETAHIVTSIHI